MKKIYVLFIVLISLLDICPGTEIKNFSKVKKLIDMELKKYKRFPSGGWWQIEERIKNNSNMTIPNKYLREAQKYYVKIIIDRNRKRPDRFETFEEFARVHPFPASVLEFSKNYFDNPRYKEYGDDENFGISDDDITSDKTVPKNGVSNIPYEPVKKRTDKKVEIEFKQVPFKNERIKKSTIEKPESESLDDIEAAIRNFENQEKKAKKISEEDKKYHNLLDRIDSIIKPGEKKKEPENKDIEYINTIAKLTRELKTTHTDIKDLNSVIAVALNNIKEKYSIEIDKLTTENKMLERKNNQLNKIVEFIQKKLIEQLKKFSPGLKDVSKKNIIEQFLELTDIINKIKAEQQKSFNLLKEAKTSIEILKKKNDLLKLSEEDRKKLIHENEMLKEKLMKKKEKKKYTDFNLKLKNK